jgi:hypothetical protein
MNILRRRSDVLFLLLIGAAAFLAAARPAHAQTTVSTFTLPVSGTASPLKTGLPETVAFSGSLVITATVVTDPALPPGVVVTIDGQGVTGVGKKTGTVYLNSLFANLTRPFGPTDSIQTTFAFFANAPGSYMSAKTGVLTLNLTYDTTTLSLTNVTGSLAAF